MDVSSPTRFENRRHPNEVVYTTQWTAEVSGGLVSHKYSYLAPSVESSWENAAALRLLCHVLLDEIADAAMSECASSLESLYMFHRVPVSFEPRALPPVKVKGKVATTRVRPEFSALEE